MASKPERQNQQRRSEGAAPENRMERAPEIRAKAPAPGKRNAETSSAKPATPSSKSAHASKRAGE